MRKFSIAWLLTLTTAFAFAVCAFAVQLNNSSLKTRISELEWSLGEEVSKASGLEKSKAYLVDKNNQLGFGLALVSHLCAQSGSHTHLLTQLGELQADSMNCSLETFPDMPNIRLLVFRIAKPKPNYISRLFASKSKTFESSVCVLVKHDSFEVIDSASHVGENGGGYLLVNRSLKSPWSLHWDQADGSEIKYKITEDGFVPIEAAGN